MKAQCLAVVLVVTLLAVSGMGQQQQQPCPGVCPLQRNPVCGSDSTTYDNLCRLLDERRCNQPQLTVVTFSECGGQNCPRFCPLHANEVPQCDQHGNVYSSRCFFDVARCHDPSLRLAPCPKYT